MGVVAVLAGVALATVFTVSGVAKLLDRDGTRQAVAGFGVPERLAGPAAVALPPVEIAVALLVVLPATATAGFAAALLLVAAFTAAVAWALNTGRRPECHCFGRLGGADVSVRTVVRNGVLLTLAALGLAAAGTDRPSGGRVAAAVVAGLALAAAILAAEALAGRAARRRREAADEVAFTAGAAAAPEVADIALTTLADGETSLSQLLAPGRPLLLVTLSPGCGPCKKLRPDVASWAQVLSSRVTVAALATGSREHNLASYQEFAHLTVLLDEDGTARQRLGTTAAPSAVLVGPDGRLASGVASGEALVRRLLVQALTGTTVEEAEPDAEGVPAADLEPTSRVSRRPSVESHDLGGSFVLLDTATGATVMVDALGALVWSVLDGSPLDEVVSDLAEVFQAPRETVTADVLSLVRSLGEAGLLAGVVPTTPRVDLEGARGVA